MRDLVLLSIPSPSSPLIGELGPFRLRWYGTLLALGVLLAGVLTQRELRRRGRDGDVAYAIAAWCVPGGIIGARLYHVVTDWERFSGHPARIPQIWEGGLGLPGVILGGAIGAAIAARRVGLPVGTVFDCVAPGLIAAQALGRWGNYFNQELFGGPTDLPWGLEIDFANRPARFAGSATFHPTFLYESLWNLLVLAALYALIRRRFRLLRPGGVFAAYLVGYSLGRIWIEGLRVDPAHEWLGLRLNQYVFTAVLVLAALYLRRAWEDRAAPVEPERSERPVSLEAGTGAGDG